MYSIVLMMALTGSAEVPAGHGCHGCCGCSCSCHGHKSHGCHGCCGCHGHKHKHGCHGCCSSSCCGGYSCCGGCCGGYSCCGGYACNGCAGTVIAPAAPMVAPAAPADGGATPPPPPPPAKKAPKEEASAAPATIFVSLPADAKLTVDGAATTSTSATRVFATPVLENGREFVYTLTAQVTRDGKVLSATQRVTVRAGEETRVALDIQAATGVASK